jgi:aminoglycoside phosphotransferase (APT) family kinase protein
VEGLRQLTGGASRETFAFSATTAGGAAERLVLRRDPPGRPSEPGAMTREAAVMAAAASAGLAVPEVLLATDEASAWGSAGLVMRHVDGETVPRRILRDETYHDARSRLVAECARFLAGLHRIEPATVTELDAADPVARLTARLDELAELDESFALPTFDLAIRWLGDNQPPAGPPVIVHGDFRLGNLIVGLDGLRAVLDWELVHAGDPRDDLGWLCVKAWRFGVDRPVAGLGTREDLLDEYHRAGGVPVTLGELHWWEVLNTLKWGVTCIDQAWAHLSGVAPSVELAAIGRRVCEQEWDLLLLLAPAACAAAAADRPVATRAMAGAGHGRPTAGELLDAVRSYLAGDVMAATDGRVQFHARVAANVVGIVARELELGPVAPPHDPNDPVDLARSVAAKLAVANPAYLSANPS